MIELYWQSLHALVIIGFLALFRIHRLWEAHHLYWGILLALIPCWPTRMLGLVLVFDDTMQHGRQAVESLIGVRQTPDWSPVHRLYVWAAHQFAH